ncbi:hypothetical protein [Lentisalinibacter salinarum]|uniref:hypothetical protein n=1 Tax=Lentisalinibacter salinarum TaxID=2992239 RepID=UPI00386755B6
MRLDVDEQQFRQPQQQLRQPEQQLRQPEQRFRGLALRVDERLTFGIDGQQLRRRFSRRFAQWFAERIHGRDARRHAG